MPAKIGATPAIRPGVACRCARPVYRDIAGDWHRNGTRDHDITEGSNALSVLSTSTEGFRDLQLRERGGKWRRTFRWSAADGEYQPR